MHPRFTGTAVAYGWPRCVCNPGLAWCLPTNTTGYTSLSDHLLLHPLLYLHEHPNNSGLLLPSIGHPSSRAPSIWRLRSPGPLAPAKTDGSSHPEAILLRLKFAALPPKHGQPQVLLPGTELKAEWPVRSHSPAALGGQGLHSAHFPLSCLNPVSQVLVNTHIWGNEGRDDGIRFVLKTDICLISSLFFSGSTNGH